MANVGRTVPNTLAKTPITFAMIETADSQDCNDRKGLWLNYGFKDVTPTFGSRSTVPSLNDGQVASGRQMLSDMASINADWYMVSGHHGALYQSDYGRFTTDGQPLKADRSNQDAVRTANEEEYCGFFNEAYHLGRWEHSSRDAPDPSSPPSSMATWNANAIYLRTTAAAPNDIAPFTQTNPLLDATHSGPKGIIISACNTLIYKSARSTWATAFPNAVIIGAVSRIASGTWITNAVAAAQMTNESFWRDPQSVLDQPGNCEQLQKQLAAGFPRSGIIGLVYKNKFYWNIRDSSGNYSARTQAPGDPLVTHG